MEAALNLLREQILAVRDARIAIVRDDALKASDPAHHHQLMIQTRRELGQLARAISVLDRIERGEAEVIDVARPSPVTAPAAPAPPPMRDAGLVRRTPELRA